MKIDEIILKYVKEKLEMAPHDFNHTIRVFNMAKEIAVNTTQEIDMQVLEYACYLHDIARVDEDKDITGKIDHAELGAECAKSFLMTIGLKAEKIDKIVECIKSHRYRKKYEPSSIEAKILFDADKLDSIGAVGVARAFMWAGAHNGPIYYKPESYVQYCQDNMNNSYSGIIVDPSKHSVQIEFELKLKRIPEIMHTDYAKKMATERVEFFQNYLEILEYEICANGKHW